MSVRDRITNRRDRVFIIGVVDLESDLPVRCRTAFCCAEQAGRFAVTADLAGQVVGGLQDARETQLRLDGGGTPELGYWPAR